MHIKYFNQAQFATLQDKKKNTTKNFIKKKVIL